MAGAHGGAAIATAATTSFYVPPGTSAAPVLRSSVVSVSSLSSPFPSRRTRRTNHLRKKILRTLENKPYPDKSLHEFPHKTETVSIEETVQQQLAESDQFSLSETTGFVDGITGKFSTSSFIKIGLYLVGAFVFQTICAVLIFGSNGLEDEDVYSNSNDHKKSRVLDLGVSGSSIRNQNLIATKDGGIVLVDESEMDKRIVEIQEMAREARQSEARRKGVVEEEEEEDDADFDTTDKTAHQKEVDDRLTKLRKGLETSYKKLPHKNSRKGDVGNDTDKGIPGAKEAFGPLMFKKKHKFKGPSIDSGDKPKGFNGAVQANIGKQMDILNGERFEISDPTTVDENKEQESIEKSMPVSEPKTESVASTTKETKNDKQAVRSARSGKSSNLEARKPRGFGKESQNDSTIFSKHDDFNGNGSLKGKRGGNRKPPRNIARLKADFWWTRLPYVLGVLMQRGGGNGEESEGLFTLRNDFETKSGLAHTVAFEDRGDATNFCYLLESFFEDLADFRTDIIPIPTNELEDAVKSEIMKVVVVKKGKLRLYAGQPLADVETALRALIEQNG